ncbi:SDR family NAD(P)-dependent oxidoreductase [Patescibacteria group bacterium]|nr:SDR family NAD(P)-dependent oxidoreductase [Patescibacteria group bacterium]
MANYFITGGAGFIGAHLAKALMKRGDSVVVYDDFNGWLYPTALKQARAEAFLTEAKIIEGDILDAKALKQALSFSSFDAVIHLAAYANPRRSLEAEELYNQVNVGGTLQLLKAATAQGVPQFLFASSSSVYNDEKTPFSEDSYPLHPWSPYGASKAAAEVYCAMWHELHGLPVTILRPFSVYGPWGRPDMAPMIFADKILSGKSIELNRDPRQRDFTYIDDVIVGIITAVDKKFEFEIINLGRGEPVNLGDLIVALEEACGREAKIIERDTPPGEMRITYADATKAKKLLSYAPNISVAEGAKKMVAWMREEYLPLQK